MSAGMQMVAFRYGGYMLCESAVESKSGKSLVITIGKCDCYKNACNCVQQFVLPKYAVKMPDNSETPTTNGSGGTG